MGKTKAEYKYARELSFLPTVRGNEVGESNIDYPVSDDVVYADAPMSAMDHSAENDDPFARLLSGQKSQVSALTCKDSQ